MPPLAAGPQHVAEQVRPVRDNPVHAKVEEPVHFGLFIDGPYMHHQAQLMGAPDEAGSDYRYPPIPDGYL